MDSLRELRSDGYRLLVKSRATMMLVWWRFLSYRKYYILVVSLQLRESMAFNCALGGLPSAILIEFVSIYIVQVAPLFSISH